MKLLCLLLLVNSICVSGQLKTISGIVKTTDDVPLEYVNIGITKKTIGTIAGTDGKFILKLNTDIMSTDTIVFSHLGFRTEKVIVSSLSAENNIIELQPEEALLEQVVITKRLPKKKKIGRSIKGLSLLHFNFYSYYETDIDDRLGKEAGMKFRNKNSCRIESLNFNITGNDFGKLKFRVKFYRITNGEPVDDIVSDDIILQIDNGFTGWFKADLAKYDIYLSNDIDDFIVTLQWIESEKANPDSKYFSISTAKSFSKDFYYREKAMDNWTTGSMNLSFYIDAKCD